MAYELQEANITDVDEMAKLFLESWKDDYLVRNIMPNTPIAEQQAFWAAAFKDDFPKPGHKFFKITETSSCQMVAFCRWIYPHKSTEEAVPEEPALPAGTNVELFTEFWETLEAQHVKHLDSEKMYYCYIIGTHPDHVKKGLASRLLNEVIKLADAQGAKILLDATPAGVSLYRSLSWMEVDEWWPIDPGKYGAPREYKWTVMVREPHGLA